MVIKFTQFLLPHGKRTDFFIDRSPEIENKAKCLLDRGVRFEIEMLSTGEILMELLNLNEGNSISSRICINESDILDNVDSMINEAYKLLVE